MFNFRWSGLAHRVRFRHIRSRKGMVACCTTAEFLQVSDDGSEPIILNSTSVKRFSTDRPNYEKARRYAMEKLLRPYPKGLRQNAWEAYFAKQREDREKERSRLKGKGLDWSSPDNPPF
jgi:hypothetical protein